MNNLVSIIMPAYNADKYIAESIQSVLNQTYPFWELIIVDDCSTDNTEDVIKCFTDTRIRYLKNKKNSGAAVSRNYALREAKGKWIAFLDGDDVWLPEKLERQLAFMIEKEIYFSYTQYEEIDEKGNLLGRTVSGPQRVSKKGMYAYCWPGCLTVMYDRERIGIIQISDIKKNNDYAIWLKVCQKEDLFLYPKVMAQYRKHSGSISRNSIRVMIRWHYRLWHEAEKNSVIKSCYYTGINLIFGFLKKIIYVKRKSKIEL